MSVRCPSCGFESAQDSAWCDFCKEHFTKGKKAAPAPPPAAPPPAAAPAQPKLSKEELLAKVPAELIASEDEEKIPVIPKWVRILCWIFLGVWFLWGMILGGIIYGRYKARHGDASAASPRP